MTYISSVLDHFHGLSYNRFLGNLAWVGGATPALEDV